MKELREESPEAPQDELEVRSNPRPIEEIVTKGDGPRALEIAKRIKFLKKDARTKPWNIVQTYSGLVMMGMSYINLQNGLVAASNYKRLIEMYPGVFRPDIILDHRTALIASAGMALGGFITTIVGLIGARNASAAAREADALTGPLATHLLENTPRVTRRITN